MSLEVDIVKRFGGFKLDVSFSAGNETLGFLGASGCGKSLTMRCIAGIETPDKGRIIVNGKTFFDSDANVNLTPQERKTALLFQSYMLFPNLTVAQNVAAGIDRGISKAEQEALVNAELVRFGLEGFESRYPSQLSGGQQQRVALARMLAAKPGILMLDEPFSALDAHLKGVLEQNLVNLFESYCGTVLYVSHDIDEALRFCDRIAVVDNGSITELGSGDELVNSPKSVAGIKLSGCKNVTPATRISEHCVHLPKWGINVETTATVPLDITHLGVRAAFVERAEGPGQNTFLMRADRVSDARFDRTVLLGFVEETDVEESAANERNGKYRTASCPGENPNEDEMKFLHRHVFWRIGKLPQPECGLPEQGDMLWIRIPPDKVYLVSR